MNCNDNIDNDKGKKMKERKHLFTVLPLFLSPTLLISLFPFHRSSPEIFHSFTRLIDGSAIAQKKKFLSIKFTAVGATSISMYKKAMMWKVRDRNDETESSTLMYVNENCVKYFSFFS